MQTAKLVSFLLLSFLFTCTSSDASSEEETAAPNSSAAATATSKLSEYFDAEVVTALMELKEDFDAKFREGYNDRPLSYVYEQHALRMKLDFLNDETFRYVFPYNGKYRLEDFSTQVAQVPFFTNKCGFQLQDSGEIINYTCLNTNEIFFTYLKTIAQENRLIESFADTYPADKTITPNTKRNMLLEASEAFDFNDIDQQVFYFIFHAIVNEEFVAAEAVKVAARNDSTTNGQN